jgi:hypothetical protein
MVERRAFTLELDPRYVDTALRRGHSRETTARTVFKTVMGGGLYDSRSAHSVRFLRVRVPDTGERKRPQWLKANAH